MNLDNTYAVVSYEEMHEAQKNAEEAKKAFYSKHKNFLITCLCQVGFANQLVRVKNTGDVGVLRVEERGYFSIHPYEIKFFPVTKKGAISLKPRYIGSFNQMHEKDLTKELLKCFELVVSSDES